jgi:type II secretory pathway component GspD/PulD (secretin)
MRFLVMLSVCIPVSVWAVSPAALHVESNDEGELEVRARKATIRDVLHALAAEAGFAVMIDDATVRPPVTITLSMATLEYALRQILRGRNHALIYDGARISEVMLLAPSTAPRPIPRSRVRAAKKTPRSGPIVVSR